MLGTIVNVLTIVFGSVLGHFMRNGIKDKYKNTIMDGLGLAVLIIGIMGSIKSENILILIGSIVIGSIIGEIIEIERKLNNLGHRLEKRFGHGDSNFSKGFITATLMFCVGAMAVVGSLEAGLTGNYQTLFAKSILDGVAATIFASTLGLGVMFAAVPVFIYQGTITLLATSLKDLLTPEVINEMSAVGGLLILAIGINLLEIKKIKIANMLPSILIPIVILFLKAYIGF